MNEKQISIELTINGKLETLQVESNCTLLEALREKFHLTGTKCGCNKGECGACTVLMNGKPILSCLTLAVNAHKQEITTIEGLSTGRELHPIQRSFIDNSAIQCGFCTPGMIVSAKALLDEKPHPSEEEIRYGMNGNICRCTGYEKIVEAVKTAAGDR